MKTLANSIALVFALVTMIATLAGSIWLARFICRRFHITGHMASITYLLTDFVVFTSLIVGCYRWRDKLLDRRKQ